jgi:hypothetical protein
LIAVPVPGSGISQGDWCSSASVLWALILVLSLTVCQ